MKSTSDNEKTHVFELEIMKKASEKCKTYKLKGFHCSEASIRACSEVLGLNLSEDILRTASGFRGGGGGYADRCGILEAGCMLISYLYGRLTPQQEMWDYSYLIRVLHQRFEEHFNTIYCRDIITKELEKKAEPICMSTYNDAAAIIVKLIFDAPSLLANIPEEEKNKLPSQEIAKKMEEKSSKKIIDKVNPIKK